MYVGNLITLQLKKHAGQWTLKMASANPYTLKVIGENSMVHYPQYEYLCLIEKIVAFTTNKIPINPCCIFCSV